MIFSINENENGCNRLSIEGLSRHEIMKNDFNVGYSLDYENGSQNSIVCYSYNFWDSSDEYFDALYFPSKNGMSDISYFGAVTSGLKIISGEYFTHEWDKDECYVSESYFKEHFGEWNVNETFLFDINPNRVLKIRGVISDESFSIFNKYFKNCILVSFATGAHYFENNNSVNVLLKTNDYLSNRRIVKMFYSLKKNYFFDKSINSYHDSLKIEIPAYKGPNTVFNALFLIVLFLVCAFLSLKFLKKSALKYSVWLGIFSFTFLILILSNSLFYSVFGLFIEKNTSCYFSFFLFTFIYCILQMLFENKKKTYECNEKNIAFVCNESNLAISFRKELVCHLISKGYIVHILCADSERQNEIEKLGAKFYVAPLKNRSLNPFKFFDGIRKTKKILKSISPRIVFTFQLKPNIIGTLAASKIGCDNIFCMVEGLGDPFQPTNFKWRIIRKIVCIMYKMVFKKAKKVFFLNNDDKKEILNRKIIEESKCCVIHGIGIDTKEYLPVYTLCCEKRVIMLARLIKNKGIYDFCDIARRVKGIRKDIIFDLYGSESQITKENIQPYIDDGSINYFGFDKEIKEKLINCRIVLSTSFREGFPRTILEAMALGKTVVATNVIGNKDAVINEKTGFLLPIHDIDAFANKIINIIDNDQLLIELGSQAREICESKYDSSIINELICKVIL